MIDTMQQASTRPWLSMAWTIIIGFLLAGSAHGENREIDGMKTIANTYWKLIELNGQPAVLDAGNRELHMVLTIEGDRVQGFSGCNKFTGNYQQGDGQLHFEPLASSRMACITGMEQEKHFLDALESTVRYALSGESLSLYDRHDQLILRFESVYLK